MSQFAAPEEQGDLDLMARLKEFAGPPQFDVHIVLTDFEPHTDLLDVLHLSVAAVTLLLLGALVIVFTPIDDLDDRLFGIGGYLHQIELLQAGCLKGFGPGHNTHLVTVGIGDTDFGSRDSLVQAGMFADVILSSAFRFYLGDCIR